MSTIDQAFVKAFHKNRQAIDSTESPERSEEARAAALGMSTIWIDPNNEQRWRTDQAHSQPNLSSNHRLPGGSPGRMVCPPRPISSRDSQPVAPGDAPDRSESSQPGSVETVPPSNRGEGKPSVDIAETTFDIHMFDAIDVTPSPFAIFSQTRTIDEPPPTQAAAPTDTTKKENAGGEGSGPSSVPFVKIHQRPHGDFPETAASEALTSSQAPAVEENKPFEAAWEVDRFEYPSVVKQLLDEEGLVADAVVPLVEACRGGLQTLVVTSPATQQGRTTLAIGLAIAAARAGLQVALLDLDVDRPALADRLQLEVESGWTEAVRKRMPLQETAIYSVEDRLTLLPSMAPSPPILPTREEIVETLNTLRASFDLIILDSAAIDMEAAMKSQLPANQLDSALVVRDRRERNESGFEECVAALRQMGIEHIGVADNFVDCSS